MRYPSSKSTNSANATTKPVKPDRIEHHEELDILDSLDLGDAEPSIPLRDLLLASPDDATAQQKLAGYIDERLLEGHGEAVFDLGFETNGESMRLTKEEWDIALKRLKDIAKKERADCDILLTKNVGGDVEAKSTTTGNQSRDTDCTGKILLRRAPTTIEEVIETRIAVVGNGECLMR